MIRKRERGRRRESQVYARETHGELETTNKSKGALREVFKPWVCPTKAIPIAP